MDRRFIFEIFIQAVVTTASKVCGQEIMKQLQFCIICIPSAKYLNRNIRIKVF